MTSSKLENFRMVLEDDIPTKEQLEAAAARLEKDCKILKSYNIDTRNAEAQGFEPVISFLRMMMIHGKKKTK